MPEITALIFDFDGVIVDTETPDFATWQQEFRARGVERDRELWSSFIGSSMESFDICGHLEDLTGRCVDREALQARRRRRYLNIVNSKPVLPGIMEYFALARRCGMKIGVASSSTRSWVEGHLERLGLISCVDSIKTRDNVTNVKPDPELYLLSLDSLGVSFSEGIAIEDSVNGIISAVTAGLFCVAVPNEMTKSMDMSLAHLKLDSLTEISFREMLDLAGDHV